MRSLELTVRSSVDADNAYQKISRFEQYPDLVDEVRSVRVLDGGVSADTLHSEWEVYFRNGPLRWAEVDYFQPGLRRITFEQTSGDFHIFRGSWQVRSLPEGCEVIFETTFDFGIVSLEGVLEPVATKVLKEGIGIVLHRLLGDAAVVDDPATAAAIALRLGRESDPALTA